MVCKFLITWCFTCFHQQFNFSVYLQARVDLDPPGSVNNQLGSCIKGNCYVQSSIWAESKQELFSILFMCLC